MKQFLIILGIVLSAESFEQKMFVQYQQENGISSFTRGILPFDFRYSNQSSLFAGVKLSEKVDMKFGLGYQESGARDEITFTDSLGYHLFDFDQYYNYDFLKMPLDISIIFGAKGIFRLDMGVYFNYNLARKLLHSSSKYAISYPLIKGDDLLLKNDIGIRIMPAFEFPISERHILSLGIRQEFGLLAFIAKTRHYNTYFSAGFKYLL